MCGITGAIWTKPELSIDGTLLKRMTDVLHHRGPDEEGTYISEYRLRPPYEAMPGIALGHRRLSIIDLAGGRQPMSNEDGSIWTVFNGEIYNYQALRNRLEGAGHSFRTSCDTEAIVHLYEDEGTNCFSQLNGMFGIAIWDANRRRLVLGRDRLGQKPVVYHCNSDRLIFASELKSILEVPNVARQIDRSAVDEYLTYQYIPHPNTIFRGIRKLPPGHCAVFQDGRLSVKSYWNPDPRHTISSGPAQSRERLRELLSESVRLRMRSDVPLGAFLSGGIDSSIIVALMQDVAEQPVKTFSIGFPVCEYDESAHARRVAQHLQTDHHEFQVVPDSVKVLPELVWHYDEPFADSSAIPTWYVSKLSREHVTVSLTGDGGDELFAGYSRYRAVQMAQRIDAFPSVLRNLISAPWWQKLPASTRQKSLRRRLKRFAASMSLTATRRYVDWIAIFNEARRAELYTDEFLAELPDSDPVNFVGRAWSRVGNRGHVTAASLADLATYLPCDLMTKVDISSMAHSLECRQPFLDHHLVEFAMSLPESAKLRRGRGKSILRETFGHLLPKEINRRPKMGFGVPLDHWFRNELKDMAHDVLLDKTAKCRGLFRSETVSRLLNEHIQGRFDHSYRLWSLLIFELWMRKWVE